MATNFEAWAHATLAQFAQDASGRLVDVEADLKTAKEGYRYFIQSNAPRQGEHMKTVIEMAKEAGLFTHKEMQPELERFAKLVRAEEREACAKVAEDYLEESEGVHFGVGAAIREGSNS